MQLQVKIFLFCLSLVLMTGPVAPKTPAPNKPQPTIPDITVVKCDNTLNKITVKATTKKTGFYYQCADYTKLDKCNEKGKSDGKEFDIDKAKTGMTKLLRFDLAIMNKVLTGKYDQYEIDCNIATKVKATGNIKVTKNGKNPKTINNGANKKVDIIFNPDSTTLGTPVTMTFEEKKPNAGEIKMIKVIKCSAKSTTSTSGSPIEIYDGTNPGELKIQKTSNPPSDILTFNAFRLVNQDGDDITFECDVWICSDDQNCNIPANPGPPQPYSASVGGGFDKVVGVLSVHIPQYLGSDVIPSSADKVCSYTNGFLLTMGAVVLQRQLVQN